MAAASIIASVTTGGSNSHQTVAEELNAYATDFVTQGVVGSITSGLPATGAFAVTQDSSPDMGVTVLLGQAYVAGTPSSQDAQVLRARMTSNYTGYTINANSSGSTKYDWIYLQLNATNANNPDSAADNVINLYTSRSTSNASDTGSPPTYGLLLAVVTVANGASSITNANISDRRVQASISNPGSSSSTGWQSLGYALTYGANNGNKEFTVTTPNNLTGILSPGMKLEVSRSVSPPTQCMSFASASSQYATLASPSGLSFTSAFTCEAWVYLNSYTGAQNTIVSRRSGTSGAWALRINASGQPEVYYGDGAGNFTIITAYQSIPLNTWVHVAGVISSTSSKTGSLYINGLSVTASNTTNSATSLVQTGNLSLGCYGAGAGDFFNGYLSEVRVWSVAQTGGSIQSNMAINLVGNETNLVTLFQGNGNFNDATTNANNLTATNGASATQANNPYNATEYAQIVAVSYSNPTTTLTLYTGNTCNIPNQTLNNPSYSVVQEPYGLPQELAHFRRYMQINNTYTTTTSSEAQVPGLTLQCTIPSNISKVKVSAYTPAFQYGNTTVTFDIWDGTVGSGTQIASSQSSGGTTTGMRAWMEPKNVVNLTAGSHTFNVATSGSSGAGITATNSGPMFILVEG